MSRKRSAKIRRSSKITGRLKNSNVMVLKLVDPIVQSFIFIYFVYCLDSAVVEPSYRTVLLVLLSWQLLSAFLNFFLKDPKLLKTERTSFVLIIIVYMVMFFYVEGHVKERYIGINETDIPNIPLHQTILMVGAVILSFWYTIICYREIKSLLNSPNKNQ